MFYEFIGGLGRGTSPKRGRIQVGGICRFLTKTSSPV